MGGFLAAFPVALASEDPRRQELFPLNVLK
jgi:hypothetical protein